MVVSNLLFDIVLFGALFLAAFADGAFPITGGVATLIVVGAATYIAAQEWCDALLRRRIWTQEALSTAIALSALGFIYFWWRNQSDFSLLVLSVGLMMASLMVAIALIAACGAALKDRDARPILGLALTFVGAYTLGVLGGVLALFLGGGSPVLAKVLVIGVGLFGWKIRETLRPPNWNILPENAQPLGEKVRRSAHIAGSEISGTAVDIGLQAAGLPFNTYTGSGLSSERFYFLPQRGTLLDRFIPVLVLGAILFVAARQINAPELLSATSAAPTDSNLIERK